MLQEEKSVLKEWQDMPEEVQMIFEKIVRNDDWLCVTVNEDEVEILVDDREAFRRSLLLKSGRMDRYEDIINFYGWQLVKEESGYCFYGSCEESTERYPDYARIWFEKCEVKVESYRADQQEFWRTPWDYLRMIAYPICVKAELPGEHCNAEERELIPLFKELCYLEAWYIMEEKVSKAAFPELTKLTRRLGGRKVRSLLKRMAAEHPESDRYHQLAENVKLTLCKQKYECIWREVFQRVVKSQEGYPAKTEKVCPPEILKETRKAIQEMMEQRGFSGTYPDFVKKEPIRGLHLEESYGRVYFAGLHKKSVLRIHCLESMEGDEYLKIQFLCGTALLKRREDIKDIYSCLFQASGRRLFHVVHYDVPLGVREPKVDHEELQECIEIAVKKVRLLPLNQEEKESCGEVQQAGLQEFFRIFAAMGSLFGVLMTLGLMFLELFVTLCLGKIRWFPAIFLDTPWWLILVFGWIAFGGIMGYLTVLARRK